MARRRLNFAKIHARKDALVWEAIRSRPLPKHSNIGLKFSRRPGDFAELGVAVLERGEDYGYAFTHWLDEFLLFRQPAMLEKEPPEAFGPKRRAFLAATAEYFSREFGWEAPAWTAKPEYHLDEEWDFITSMPEFVEELRDRVDGRRARATPEFLRHNIIYEARGLLRL